MKLDQSSNDVLDALRASKIRGPGPQSYVPDLSKFMVRPAPKINFGNSNRFDLIFKERQWRQNPGPGTYYKDKDSERKGSGRSGLFHKPMTSRRETFSRSQRKGIEYNGKDKDLVKASPGPSNYTLP